MTETSPDVVPLVDLTLLDLDAQALVDQAIADAETKLPDWTPREGNTEVVVLEGQALITAELIYAVNRLPDAILESLLAVGFQLERDPGVAPSATVRFTTSAPGSLTVPAGTRVRVPYGVDDAIDLLTDVDLVLTGTGTVSATAEDPTTLANGTPASADVDLVDAIAAIDTVTLVTAVTGGVDPEGSDAYIARGGSLLRRLVSTLVLPEHFTAAALEDPSVVRAITLDLYNPDVAGSVPGSAPGYVTVAVAGPGGDALPTATTDALRSTLEAKAHAAITVKIIAPTVTTVPVTVTVTKVPGAVTADVQAAVTAALADYLNPDTWAYGSTVYRNELIALIDRVAGVDRVVSIAAPSADVALTGVAPLVKVGAVAVTVS